MLRKSQTRTVFILSLFFLSLTAPRAVFADVVTDWNEMLAMALRVAGAGPGAQPRPAAIVSAAVFDAVNGIDRKYEPYFVKQWAPGGARQEAAAAQAAYTALVNLYPLQKITFDGLLAASLDSIPGSAGNAESIARGRAWGEAVALAILEWRSHDGFNAVVPPYFGEMTPGVWRSVPDGTLPAAGPQVRFMVPFAMTHPAQFRPGPPPSLTSLEYAADVNEVKAKGRATGSTRTDEETEIARLWHAFVTSDENDVARSYVVPGAELVDTARMFALLNISIADAGIYVVDAKYTYNLWRPYHAIRLADTDGNPATDPDLAWTSLIQPTPNHQEYPSAHSSVVGSGLRVLMNLLGDDHEVVVKSPGYPSFAYTYQSFSAAAEGLQNARVWGGLHFRTACRIGGRDGFALADYIVDNFLTPRKSRGRH
jgi:hypothetical protein